MASSWPSLFTLLALPSAILAITLDCKEIRDSGVEWNLQALGGPKTVHHREWTAPAYHNTTFVVDICDTLKKNPDFADDEQCPQGSRICGQRQVWKHGVSGGLDEIIPIAGVYTHEGADLNPKPERLKGSSSNEDTEREGLRLTLHGMKYNGRNQRAIIEFVCNRTVSGNEGFEDTKSRRARRSAAKDEDEGDGEGEGDHDDSGEPELDVGQSLTFVSYNEEKLGTETLRLSWHTRHACEDAAGKAPEDSPSTPDPSSRGWGFFTWFIIIAFLLIATYIIFGSWLNYNRYGARGWDLIPHGDAIRDLPYTMKDFFSSLVGKFQGGGSRGGYSAV